MYTAGTRSAYDAATDISKHYV